jgi:hypothetical protein
MSDEKAEYFRDEEGRYPDLTLPDGFTKAHGPIFRAIRRECSQSDLFADRFLKFAQGPNNHTLLVLKPPLKGKWDQNDAKRPFLSIEVAGPESLYVYDAGMVDIHSSYACKHKGPLERPWFNYEQWEELRADPFAAIESPIMVGILLRASDSPDAITSKLNKLASLVFRVMCACKTAVRYKRIKKQAEGEDPKAGSE